MYELSVVAIEKSAPKSLIIKELSKLMGVSLKQAKEHLEFLIKDQQPIDLRRV